MMTMPFQVKILKQGLSRTPPRETKSNTAMLAEKKTLSAEDALSARKEGLEAAREKRRKDKLKARRFPAAPLSSLAQAAAADQQPTDPVVLCNGAEVVGPDGPIRVSQIQQMILLLAKQRNEEYEQTRGYLERTTTEQDFVSAFFSDGGLTSMLNDRSLAWQTQEETIDFQQGPGLNEDEEL
jgi:hypothetical protein